jgi:Fe2+ transport system protein FeoA
MMTLDQLQKGDMAIIKKIESSDELKQRLSAFGILRGSEIVVEAFSLKKKTIEIKVHRSHIALRLDEAKKIEVQHQCTI